MSDVTNNNLAVLEQYFDYSIDVDDFIEMDDREVFLTQLIQEHSLSESEIEDFEAAYEEEIVALHDEAYVARAELRAMLDSENLSVGEKASVELALADLDALIAVLGDEDDLLDEWGDALDTFESQNVEIKQGESHTLDVADASAGETYSVTVVEGEETLGAFDKGSAQDGWWDTDSDGYTDTFWDNDGDGIADKDFNNDNVIDEFDNAAYSAPSSQPTVTIQLEEGDTLDFSSYEAGPPSVSTFKVTKDNGDEVFIQITGEAKIISETVPENLNSMPSDVTSRMYEGTDKKFPYSYYIDGTLPDYMSDTEIQSIVSMSDQDDNSFEINPTSDDYINGREYTIDFETATSDVLDINLSPDAEVSFSQTGNTSNLIVMTITTDEGTITINLQNMEVAPSATDTTSDFINIDGGSVDYESLNGIGVKYEGLAAYYIGGLYSLVSHDDELTKDIYDESTGQTLFL